jgi:hypothetical protein
MKNLRLWPSLVTSVFMIMTGVMFFLGRRDPDPVWQKVFELENELARVDRSVDTLQNKELERQGWKVSEAPTPPGPRMNPGRKDEFLRRQGTEWISRQSTNAGMVRPDNTKEEIQRKLDRCDCVLFTLGDYFVDDLHFREGLCVYGKLMSSFNEGARIHFTQTVFNISGIKRGLIADFVFVPNRGAFVKPIDLCEPSGVKSFRNSLSDK